MMRLGDEKEVYKGFYIKVDGDFGNTSFTNLTEVMDWANKCKADPLYKELHVTRETTRIVHVWPTTAKKGEGHDCPNPWDIG